MIETDTNSESRIVGDYYHGAYGPTILLKANSERAVEWLRNIFLRLANGTESHVDLAAMPGVNIAGVEAFMLGRLDEQPEVALQSQPTDAQAVECYWNQDASGWRHVAMLMEPFLAGKTGHQYLTREGQDDALLEVSYGESDVS